tara:strand:+ start:600 stop:803 length:204 start_codon:yes stop_codon:yes gene_type:complete
MRILKNLTVFNIAFFLGMLFGTTVSTVTIFYAVPNIIEDEKIISLTKELLGTGVQMDEEACLHSISE